MKKALIITSVLVILIAIVGGAYWYFLFKDNSNTQSESQNTEDTSFSPFGRQTDQSATTTNIVNEPAQTSPISILRLLSNTPVGGYGASTTASSTIVRWVDRGRGNVYEVDSNNKDVITLANTLLPKMYESVWGANINSFIGSVLQDEDTGAEVLFAEIKKRTVTASTSATEFTPYELKGRTLPNKIIAYAFSPKKDKFFFVVNDNGRGIGYISMADGKNPKQLFTTPLTQINAEWPEENTIAITTKASYSQFGYLYSVNAKTGIWKKVFGPQFGLTAKVSKDAKKYIASYINSSGKLKTEILSIDSGNSIDALIVTIADKCVWSSFLKEIVYCAAPSKLDNGNYPDDWFTGKVSMSDKIWQIDSDSGEIGLISSLVDRSDRIIDAYNMSVDDKDNFLYFMNKRDLSLWSLDLSSSF